MWKTWISTSSCWRTTVSNTKTEKISEHIDSILEFVLKEYAGGKLTDMKLAIKCRESVKIKFFPLTDHFSYVMFLCATSYLPFNKLLHDHSIKISSY